jgi:hypothetical protein
MKKIASFVLIVGFLMTILTSYNLVTRVIDVGSIEFIQRANHAYSWSTAVGLTLLVGGGVVYIFSRQILAARVRALSKKD